MRFLECSSLCLAWPTSVLQALPSMSPPPGGLPGLMCLSSSFFSKVPIGSLHGEFANAYLLVCLLVRCIPHWCVSSVRPGITPGLCSHLHPALSTVPAHHHCPMNFCRLHRSRRRLLASCVAGTDPDGGGFHPYSHWLAFRGDRRAKAEGLGVLAEWSEVPGQRRGKRLGPGVHADS